MYSILSVDRIVSSHSSHHIQNDILDQFIIVIQFKGLQTYIIVHLHFVYVCESIYANVNLILDQRSRSR